jgi:hypothetical protein
MIDESLSEHESQWDPTLIEFVVEMVGLDRQVLDGDEEGLHRASSILQEAANLQRSIDE